MSRIPMASRLQPADRIQSGKSFLEKVEIAKQSYTDHMATMTALHYEAMVVINRPAVLVDRSASAALIDKAADAMEQWIQAVVEASVMIKKH